MFIVLGISAHICIMRNNNSCFISTHFCFLSALLLNTAAVICAQGLKRPENHLVYTESPKEVWKAEVQITCLAAQRNSLLMWLRAAPIHIDGSYACKNEANTFNGKLKTILCHLFRDRGHCEAPRQTKQKSFKTNISWAAARFKQVVSSRSKWTVVSTKEAFRYIVERRSTVFWKHLEPNARWLFPFTQNRW